MVFHWVILGTDLFLFAYHPMPSIHAFKNPYSGLCYVLLHGYKTYYIWFSMEIILKMLPGLFKDLSKMLDLGNTLLNVTM